MWGNELLPEPVGQTGKDAGREPVHRYYIVCGQEQCGSGSGLARLNGSIGVSEYSYLIPQKQIKELINNELSGNKE